LTVINPIFIKRFNFSTKVILRFFIKNRTTGIIIFRY
jgi:hypothetical protein